jgi:hypothetical protein
MDRGVLLGGLVAGLALIGLAATLNAAINWLADWLADRYDLRMTRRLGLPYFRRHFPRRGDRVLMASGRQAKVLKVSHCDGTVHDVVAVRPLGANGKPDRRALVQWVRDNRIFPVPQLEQTPEPEHAEINGGR